MFRFNKIPIKIPEDHFVETDTDSQNFKWKPKGPRIAKDKLKNIKLEDLS